MFRYLCKANFLVLLLGFSNLIATTPSLAQEAYLIGARLTLPTVDVDGQYYRAELDIVPDTEPVELVLTSGLVLATAAPSNPATFSNNTLNIPFLSFGGTDYKLGLELVNPSPMRFRLSSATPIVSDNISNPASIDEAMLSFNDFENGLFGSVDASPGWKLESNIDGNSYYCNAPGNTYSSFRVGDSSWSNYAFEARVRRNSNNADGYLELYARFDNSNGNGYRAALTKDYAFLSYASPSKNWPGKSVDAGVDQWVTLRVELVGTNVKFFVNGQLVSETTDSSIANGVVGVGANPNTSICIDDLKVWAIDEKGPVDRDVLGAPDPFNTALKYAGACTFCFMSEDPLSPVANGQGGYRPNDSDTREQIVIDQTFSVPAGQEVIWDNKIVWVRPTQRGNINVFGKLTIENSLLLWEQNQHQQTRLIVKDGGSLSVASSYAFTTNPFLLNWDYESGSTIYYDKMVSNHWTALSGSVNYTSKNYSSARLTIFENVHNANIQISNAHHVWLEVFPPAGNHTIVFPDKKPVWANWHLNGLWPATTVAIEESYIYDRDISLTADVHATIADTPSGFSVGWAVNSNDAQTRSCEIRGLGDPNNNDGKLYTKKSWDVSCNNSSLTVINSKVQRAWPNPYGNVTLRVYDSNLVDPRNFGNPGGSPTTFEVYNSRVENLAAYQGGRVYAENVKIGTDIEVKDNGTRVYGYNVARSEGTGPVTVIQAGGGLYIELSEPGAPWATP
ncbi:hypothetical protein [Pseudohongiella sp.]|uniref:Uncharacterized protein n=1 Tax=marine sediment metagenome TaxID=412755 RepID=A0A0F9VRX0_9ZZZZ|nr:hypothetical protein [Pseudohongiella sp.]HDZ09996.1 hypothetical protein [Pseudohongiella sp.]HEA63892.1 hypothetical protein [Pseudohongiella sp.]